MAICSVKFGKCRQSKKQFSTGFQTVSTWLYKQKLWIIISSSILQNDQNGAFNRLKIWRYFILDRS